MNINDVGYNVTIGEPVVDAKGVADSGLSFPCKAIPDGDYLVTLEVNGTVIAGRDKATFASGSATVGDYTLSYSSYAVSVATLTDDDVVVLRIEPLDVKVSDAFRAVVGASGAAAGGSAEPLVYYSGTMSKDQVTKDAAGATNTDAADLAAIAGALESGRHVILKDTLDDGIPHVVTSLFKEANLSGGFIWYAVASGYGSKGTTTQTMTICSVSE